MIIIILIGPFKMHDYRVTMGDRVRTDSPHLRGRERSNKVMDFALHSLCIIDGS